jgi:hypothetical protein
MSARQMTEARNVVASATNAAPVRPPNTSTIHPPIAGPSIRHAAGRTN